MTDSTLGTEGRWDHFMGDLRTSANVHTPLEVRGTLTRLAGLVLEAVGLRVPVGSQCLIANGAKEPVLAEVVGFSSDRAFLMPAGDTHGLASGASRAANTLVISHSISSPRKLGRHALRPSAAPERLTQTSDLQ